MSRGLIFGFLGVRLDVKQAQGKKLTINIVFPDRNEKFLLELNNSHLNNIQDMQARNPDAP